MLKIGRLYQKKLENPFNQKLELFNTVIGFFQEKGVKFSVSECMPRIKNKKIGSATQLAYDIADILWKVKQGEKSLRHRHLWNKIPEDVRSLVNFEIKAKEATIVTQASCQNFATLIRGVVDKVVFGHPNLLSLRVLLLSTSDVFVDLSEALKKVSQKVNQQRENKSKLSTSAEVMIHQIAEREKVTLIDKGSHPMTHPVVEKLTSELLKAGVYKAVNLSTMLPTNRKTLSKILHRDLPRQAC